MKNSRWMIYRVGLLNFWYYDEEEFRFLDGRMLLRGSNGSGKSVTMQSFIPLLLDGNMRPERLDPFGSRARKMENYLLEEDDEREERIGYLYMELKRGETDQYVTIGIGMRGRKNKKLDSWYFCITDGRRIGKDVHLYKDLQSKIPYTKTELRNRIGDGGKVMDSQKEYMECVNRLLFGFETMDEYREMLELLIQLRTPKLSKDFKPSIINDILSNSLQTLSEDDLRPMSEAIENMDNIKTNVENLKTAIKAAEAIDRAFGSYNQRMLYDKSIAYLQGIKEEEQLQKKNREANEELSQREKELSREKEHYEELKRENDILEEESQSLKTKDAFDLKNKEQELLDDIKIYGQQLDAKKSQEEKKRDNLLDVEEKQKKQETENVLTWDRLEENLEEMEVLVEDIPFDAGGFFVKELQEAKGEEYPFEAHEKEYMTYRKQVEQGIHVLQKEQRIAERYDEKLEELDRCKQERSAIEKEVFQYDGLLHEAKEELLEAFYQWNQTNAQLVISDESMQQISVKIHQYQYGKDYSEVKDIVRSERGLAEDLIQDKKRKLQMELVPKQEELAGLQKELEEWEQKKDPEPERTVEVIENRKKLRELNIPFYPFYEMVDFAEAVSDEQANRLEEALYRMGILDALVVSPEYKEQIFALGGGLCDRYVFGDAAYISENIMACLDMDNTENDILFYQAISSVLTGIGIQCEKNENSTWIDEEGNYRLGILEGNTSGQYQSKFIGVAARERYRAAQIASLQEQVSAALDEVNRLQGQVDIQENALGKLKEEESKMPSEDGVISVAKELASAQYQLENIQQDLAQKEKALGEQRKELDAIRLEVQEVCAKAYLTIRLDVFEAALETLKDYEGYFQNVKNDYVRYLSGLTLEKGYVQQREEIEFDLDEIRYDIGRINNQIQKAEAKLASVREQLKLSDYDQIKERLDYCTMRLRELPVHREQCVSKQSEIKKEMEHLRDLLDKNQGELQRKSREKEQLELVFVKEYELGYVVPFSDSDEDKKSLPAQLAREVAKQLESQVSSQSVEELNGKVQEVFHENKGYLSEHRITIQTVFGELREICDLIKIKITRLDIRAKYRGMAVNFSELLEKLQADAQMQERLLSDKDKELFEDILANTISKKIRAKIHASKRWVKNMNELMESMETSSGLRLSLKWRSKKAETEEQIDTRELVELLEQDAEILTEEQITKMSMHFRSKIGEARKNMENQGSVQSFHVIMREILDYRKWFEFCLVCQKTGEKKKDLTDRVFFTFSGGEKAMSMYVPLFSAVVAKYSGARTDAPRLISLDEAFAGVDEMNIKDMFRLMVELEFNFMINSQILWGDYDTVPSLAIYQLLRPQNAKFVSVISYVWNGKNREMVEKIGDEIE